MFMITFNHHINHDRRPTIARRPSVFMASLHSLSTPVTVVVSPTVIVTSFSVMERIYTFAADVPSVFAIATLYLSCFAVSKSA